MDMANFDLEHIKNTYAYRDHSVWYFSRNWALSSNRRVTRTNFGLPLTSDMSASFGDLSVHFSRFIPLSWFVEMIIFLIVLVNVETWKWKFKNATFHGPYAIVQCRCGILPNSMYAFKTVTCLSLLDMFIFWLRIFQIIKLLNMGAYGSERRSCSHDSFPCYRPHMWLAEVIGK